MSTATASKGSWFLKTLGVVTLIGVIVAIGSIIVKALEEESGADEGEGHQGV